MESVEVDPIELHIIRLYRELKSHGWGELHVLIENSAVVNSWTKYTDDPKKLRELQSNHGRRIVEGQGV